MLIITISKIAMVMNIFFDGDTFFPVINARKWKLVSSEDCTRDAKHAYDYSLQLWEKKPETKK